MAARERPEKKPPRFPWLVTAIVVVAVAVIVVGLIVAVASGIRMF